MDPAQRTVQEWRSKELVEEPLSALRHAMQMVALWPVDATSASREIWQVILQHKPMGVEEYLAILEGCLEAIKQHWRKGRAAKEAVDEGGKENAHATNIIIENEIDAGKVLNPVLWDAFGLSVTHLASVHSVKVGNSPPILSKAILEYSLDRLMAVSWPQGNLLQLVMLLKAFPPLNQASLDAFMERILVHADPQGPDYPALLYQLVMLMTTKAAGKSMKRFLQRILQSSPTLEAVSALCVALGQAPPRMVTLWHQQALKSDTSEIGWLVSLCMAQSSPASQILRTQLQGKLAALERDQVWARDREPLIPHALPDYHQFFTRLVSRLRPEHETPLRSLIHLGLASINTSLGQHLLIQLWQQHSIVRVQLGEHLLWRLRLNRSVEGVARVVSNVEFPMQSVVAVVCDWSIRPTAALALLIPQLCSLHVGIDALLMQCWLNPAVRPLFPQLLCHLHASHNYGGLLSSLQFARRKGFLQLLPMGKSSPICRMFADELLLKEVPLGHSLAQILSWCLREGIPLPQCLLCASDPSPVVNVLQPALLAKLPLMEPSDAVGVEGEKRQLAVDLLMALLAMALNRGYDATGLVRAIQQAEEQWSVRPSITVKIMHLPTEVPPFLVSSLADEQVECLLERHKRGLVVECTIPANLMHLPHFKHLTLEQVKAFAPLPMNASQAKDYLILVIRDHLDWLSGSLEQIKCLGGDRQQVWLCQQMVRRMEKLEWAWRHQLEIHSHLHSAVCLIWKLIEFNGEVLGEPVISLCIRFYRLAHQMVKTVSLIVRLWRLTRRLDPPRPCAR